MTSILLLDLLLFFASVLLSIVISAAEFAMGGISRSELEEFEAKGDPRATRSLRLKDHIEDVRAAVQISNTILMVLGAVAVFPYGSDWLGRVLTGGDFAWYHTVYHFAIHVVSTLCIASVYIVFVLLFAKTLGERYSAKLALNTVAFVSLLTKILHVPQRVFTILADVLLKPVGGHAQFNDAVMSEENLMDLLEDGTKSGILDQTEHELIESILEFTETAAKEIMIPRTDIVAVNFNDSPEKILNGVVQEGFTRMPVYKDSIDNIIGVIYAKDVVNLIEHRDLIILEDIIRPSFFVPETKPISELLREFQRKRIHLAVVVDEFGGTEGIITLEDILEEIVGDIRDEYDDDVKPYDLLPDGAVEVEAIMHIPELNDVLEEPIPESDDYETVGGFIISMLGRIPVAGEHVSLHHYRIEILAVEERRITRVRFVKVKSDTSGKQEE